MKSEFKALLEKAIQQFIEKTCEDAPVQGYYYPELAEQMADAAAAVYDASFKAQEYAEQENG